MSDRETERRMLDAAIALVHGQGISTGLESIPFDEVVRNAGVSRTSAYRRWPKRDRFYGDVLLELAGGTTLPAPATDIVGPAADVVLDHAPRLRSPEGHRDLVVELLRVSIGADYQVVSTSPQWRTFTVLLASHQGITDPQVRKEVTTALATAERRVTDARARAYAQFTGLLGYRLVAPLAGPDGFELMSRAAGATMSGLLTRLTLRAGAADSPRPMRAFGSTQPALWDPAVYMVASTVLAYIEPDPGVQWTQARIDDLVTALATYASTPGPGRGARSSPPPGRSRPRSW